MVLPSIDELKAKLVKLEQIVPLAQGGQKIVYKALHADYNNVALKVILSPLDDQRAQREIEVATEYHFSNVPTLFEWGILGEDDEHRVIYLLEQFINGRTLRKVLIDQKVLSLPDCLELLKVLLNTAVELEQQQLVHRDIKPENIVLDENRKFWVLDFGIARHLEKASLTITSARFGPHTAGYAAPEQFRNYKKAIDIRADLFSIGVVIYEALSGENPFRSGAHDPLEVLYRTETVLPAPLVLPGDSQRQLSGLINIMIEKFPSRRPATAKIALNYFESVLPTIKQ